MSDIGQQLIVEVRKVAAERPNYVYNKTYCQYLMDGRPSCIIGHALFNLGYLPAAGNYEGQTAEVAISRLGLSLDMGETVWLERVQQVQDGNLFLASQGHTAAMDQYERRLPWGMAVQYADGWLS